MTDLPFGVAPSVSVLHTTAAQVVDGPTMPEAIVVPLPGRDGDSMRFDGFAATYAALPATGVEHGDMYLVLADKLGYVWDGAWPPEGEGIEILGVPGDPGRGYTSVVIVGNNLVFTRTDGATETVPVPALAAATGAAGAAAGSAEAASGFAGVAQGHAQAAAESAGEAASYVGQPVDGSVTTAKIVDGAVTAGKLDPALLAVLKPADGPLAQASVAYKSAAQSAGTTRLRLLTIADSTGDGYGKPGGPDDWTKTWPLKTAELLRQRLGVSGGGRGWVGASTPLEPGNYEWLPATLTPAGLALDDLTTQIGIPGSLWLQRGDGARVDEVTWTLSPGTTAVDVVTTGYGGNMIITPAAGSPITKDTAGDRVVTRVTNPGATVNIHGAEGVGFAILGIVEYVGDDVRGVTQWNLSRGAMAAHECAAWLDEEDMSLSPMIGAYSPHVALVCLGANDYDRGRTPAQLQTALAAIHATITTASPGTEVVFIIRSLDDDPGQGTTWTAYVDAIAGVATETGGHVLDLRPTVPNDAPELYLGDGVHYTEAGNIVIAQTVAEFLSVVVAVELADVAGLPQELSRKADLDNNGKVLAAQIPAEALTEFLTPVPASQAAMLALDGQRGDWTLRSDLGTEWVLIGEPSSVLANWRERTTPASPVSSVNGRTGAVDTSSADITDSGAAGRALMKAATSADARMAIGAGTSNLAVGAGAGDAMAGNRTAGGIGGVAHVSGQAGLTAGIYTEAQYAALSAAVKNAWGFIAVVVP
ncbi:SGNH/GDSL hydrolase family protein [Rhodococcus sp. USK10]|uniref:SGNH/GDSL hydrolase family protein n=1 Tax=Rhodococcus sp. USK10 TaxID=2789739 RepID=UPI001C5F3F3D|nr:SGNH/GDSL hydrolase family protein [Rhodococcus sp. USK10]QYB01486.1 SGNH/GDSL hydrolase family protein [Rhodococcus sp. USK10]